MESGGEFTKISFTKFKKYFRKAYNNDNHRRRVKEYLWDDEGEFNQYEYLCSIQYITDKEFYNIGSRIIRDYWEDDDQYKKLASHFKHHCEKDIYAPWDDDYYAKYGYNPDGYEEQIVNEESSDEEDYTTDEEEVATKNN